MKTNHNQLEFPLSEAEDLSLFFSLSTDLFCIVENNYFKKVNPAFIELLGYSESELLSVPYIEFVHPEDRSATNLRREKASKDIATSRFENRYMKKNGDYCWLSWSSTLVKQNGLKYAVAKDITEQKALEKKLTQSTKEIASILESISDCFFSFDNNRSVRYMNKEAELFSGRKRHEVLGLPIWEAFPKGIHTPFYSLAHQAFEERKVLHHEVYYAPRKEWLETIIYPSADGLSVYLKSITEKKIKEQKLKEVNERFQLMKEATSEAIWEWEIGSEEAYWYGNKMKKLLGYSDNDPNLLSLWHQHVHADDLEPLITDFENVIKTGTEFFTNQYRYRVKSGEYLFIRNRCQVLNNNEGQPVKVIGVTDDVTHEVVAKKALVESEKSYKSLFNNAPLPQWVYDIDTLTIFDVNKAAIEHYGYTREEFLQLSLTDLFTTEEQLQLHKIIHQILNNKEPVEFISHHVKKNGEKIHVEITTTKVLYKGKTLRIATINDITEKQKLQKKITKLKVLRQKRLTQAILSAQEKERKFIGRELHDNVNQLLATSKLYIELAKERSDMHMELMERSSNHLSKAIQEIRWLTKTLTAPKLIELNLLEAIEEIINPYLLSSSFQLFFNYAGAIEQLPANIKLTLYRVIQEQLHNISKHAAPQNVWLDIEYNKEVNLVIKDDGKGFDPTHHNNGIGLSNITSRIQMLEGRVSILSQPEKGCTLKVNIPIRTRKFKEVTFSI